MTQSGRFDILGWEKMMLRSDFVMHINSAIRFFCLAFFGPTAAAADMGRGPVGRGRSVFSALGGPTSVSPRAFSQSAASLRRTFEAVEQAMLSLLRQRLIVGVWLITVGVAMAGWLAALGWIAILLVQRAAT